MTKLYFVLAALCASACAAPSSSRWTLMVAHTNDGTVKRGSTERLVAAVRNGCTLRVAWGARRKADPKRTIEHVAEPVWVSVRDGKNVEVQLEGFLSNLATLGAPLDEYPQTERFGGTDRAVWWRALLKTDGSFNAIWFAEDGTLIERIPQQHPMVWYADCDPSESTPLY